jgi:hypothetical protein
MASAVITIKVDFNGDLRRLSLPTSLSLAELRLKVAAIFGLDASLLILKYIDDENDLITLDGEDEMKEALRQCSVTSRALRLFSFVSNEPRRQLAAAAACSAPTTSTVLSSAALTASLATNAAAVAAAPSPAAECPPAPTAESTTALASSSDSIPEAPCNDTAAAHQSKVKISERTAQLVEQTSERMISIAKEIEVSTSTLCNETAMLCSEISTKQAAKTFDAAMNLEKYSKLSMDTAARVATLSEEIAARCSRLAEEMSARQASSAQLAAASSALMQPKMQSDLRKLSDATSARVGELSADMSRRLAEI